MYYTIGKAMEKGCDSKSLYNKIKACIKKRNYLT